jgi:hypothetical protein
MHFFLSAEGLGNSTKTLPGNDKTYRKFLLWGILELKLNPRRRDYVGSTLEGFGISTHRPSASGLIP